MEGFLVIHIGQQKHRSIVEMTNHAAPTIFALAHWQVVTGQNHGTAQQAGDGDFCDVGATSLFHSLYLEEVGHMSYCPPASHMFPPVTGLKGTIWFAVYCLKSELPMSEDNVTKSFAKAGSHAHQLWVPVSFSLLPSCNNLNHVVQCFNLDHPQENLENDGFARC